MKFAPAAVYLLSSLSFPGVLGTGRELRMMKMKKKSTKSKSKSKGKSKRDDIVLPVATNDNFGLRWDNDCTETINIIGNDLNVPAGYTVEITVPPRGGTVTVLGGMASYSRGDGTSCANDAGIEVEIDQFQYRICDEDGENCSNSATVIIAVYEGYSSTDVNFDRRHLFSTLQGEDLHRHLKQFEANNSERLAYCMVTDSMQFGQLVTPGECLPKDNQINSSMSEIFEYEAEPWAFPTVEGATLLASDPGLWAIEDFVSKDEADKLLDLMKRNGEDQGLYGPCRHETQNTNAHPSENKVCFKMSTENACEGPYIVSTCAHEVDPEDSTFIDILLKRFQSMWSMDLKASPYIKFHHIQGDTPPMDVHLDAGTSISLVLYLSEGGAATVFPFVHGGLSNVPKKGSALAWLNVMANGSLNHKAYHAVQAHPLSMGDRYIALFQIDLKGMKNTFLNTV